MNKYNNPRLLNTVVSGTGMKNPVRPHVIIGSEENGFIRGDLMDANAIQEQIVTEIAAREHGDEELTEYIDEKVQQAVDDLVDGAPEVLDTLKELSEALGDDANFATTITEEIASKVDKVEGKGLSTNDYTTAEKQKLAGIAAGAEVNVQSDWEALFDNYNDSAIKHKPTGLSQFNNDVPLARYEEYDANGHEYVDLGLPSGNLWATMDLESAGTYSEGQSFNFGATSLEGETPDYYKEEENLPMQLKMEDDAAHVNWGGGWQVPSDDDWEELKKYCEITYQSQIGCIQILSRITRNSIYFYSPGIDTDCALRFTRNVRKNRDTYSTLDYYAPTSPCKVAIGKNSYKVFAIDVSPVSGSQNFQKFPIRPVLKPSILSESAIPNSIKDSIEELNSSIDELNENLTFTETTDPANGHEYVDLGLPSGTKWATMNVGASSETDAGLYFQWGDTQGYTADQVGSGEGQKVFAWSDYKFNPSGDGQTFTKYNETDGKTILDIEDDAVAANWGGSWKMPTEAQSRELVNRTDKEWTTINNVNGYKFTSKTDSSKYIFIPAASSLLNGQIGEGNSVWSGSLVGNGVGGAWGLDFASDYSGVYMSSVYIGNTVRGVLDGDAQGETITTPVKEVVTDLKSNEEVIAAALHNLNTKIEATNIRIETFEDFKGSINEEVEQFTKFTPNTVGVDGASVVFNYNVNQLQDLVTDNNTEMLLTTTRNNKKLIVGTIRFFTDNFAHQVTAIATSNIHLDEWDKESSLSGVSHTDGKAYTYVCFCGLNDPAAYSGLQEGVWTDWKKLYPTMDDLDEAVNTLKNRQYMDSSTFGTIFTEADADAIDYIIDNFAPTFYVKDSSNNVVTVCSVVRSATQVCVFLNGVDEQTGNATQDFRQGTIRTNGTIKWNNWTNISTTVPSESFK